MALDDLVAQVQLLYPYLPSSLITIFADNWAETGDRELALAKTRDTDVYARTFPGIRREDGTMRMNESQYLLTKDAYRQTLLGWNLNPDLFEGRFIQAIENDLNPDEFAFRINTVASRIAGSVPEWKQIFAERFGVEATTEAILLAALDPDMGQQVIQKQIGMVDISAEAAYRNFTPDLDTVDRLFRLGVDQSGARDIFTNAAEQIPFIRDLARRHYDPNNDFTLSNYLDFAAFGDSAARQRVQRLASQEQALFADEGLIASEGDSLTGLALQDQA